MYSDRGDHVGLGQPRTLDSGNSTLNVWSDPRSVTFWINWQSDGPFYHFDIAAPPGKDLAPGVYDPGNIDLGGDGRGCNITPGRFEIFDIGFDASGQLQRLRLVFEQHCEGYPYALFGELRYGEPPSPVTPAIVRWPVTDAGRPGTAVPVVVRPKPR